MNLMIKIAAIGGFATTLAVLAYFVPEWNLIGVLMVALGMAIYDFFFRRRGTNNGG